MLWKQVFARVVMNVIYRRNWNLLTMKGKNHNYLMFQNINGTFLSNWNTEISRTDVVKKEDVSKGSNPKKITGPKITLVGTDNSISVLGLEEGQKIAKRRNLKLVKMVEYDTKTQRPVYRLISHAVFNEEYMKEKISKSHTSKREKLLTISSRIDKHDLESKVRMIEKWLLKDYEVRVIINGDEKDMSVAEGVYNSLEDFMKGKGRFLQKRQVNSDIKFQLKSFSMNKTKAEPEKSECKQPSSS